MSAIEARRPPVTRLRDLSDVVAPAGAGDDGKVWSYDHDTGKSTLVPQSQGVTDHAALSNLSYAASGHTGFEPAGAGAAAVASHVALSDPHAQYLLESLYTAADVLSKLLTVDVDGSGLNATTLQGNAPGAFATSSHTHSGGITIDTRSNIMATSPASATWAFCSDTREVALWSGSAWYFASLELDIEPTAPDMGAFNPDGLGVSDRQGYYSNKITDKVLHHVVVGHNDRTESGAIRTTTTGELQVYLAGAWAAIVTGFRFLQDSTNQAGELEYKPTGYSNYYGVMDGNSNDLGFNGLPLVQQYKASMGVYPAKVVISGGTF